MGLIDFCNNKLKGLLSRSLVTETRPVMSTRSEHVRCVLVVNRCLGWALFPSFLRCDVLRVVHHPLLAVTDLVPHLKNNAPVLPSDGTVHGAVMLASAAPNINAVFTDELPGPTSEFWRTHAKRLVITLGKCRHAPLGWTMLRGHSSHAAAGGVTDGEARVKVYYTDTAEAQVTLGRLLHDVTHVGGERWRDVFSVVDDLKAGRPAPRPPGPIPTPPCVSTGQHEGLGRFYEGYGLYPLCEPKKSVWFRVPSVRSGTKWVFRRLDQEELASVLDVPKAVAATISPVVLDNLLRFPVLLLGTEAALRQVHGVLCALRRSTTHTEDGDGYHYGHTEPPPSKIPRLNDGNRPMISKGPVHTEQHDGFSDGDDGPEGPVEEPAGLDSFEKATKSDDSAVNVRIWDNMGLSLFRQADPGVYARLTESLRVLCLRWWKRNLTRGFWVWFRSNRLSTPHKWVSSSPTSTEHQWAPDGRRQYMVAWRVDMRGREIDLAPARDAIGRAADSSWWAWDRGSGLFFWKWPESYRSVARDGLPPWFQSPPPRNLKRQRREPDAHTRTKMAAKLSAVRARGYIQPGSIQSLTSYFAVPKGPEDVRMVYDGTASGLNAAIWVPRFPLPTPEEHSRMLDVGYHMADADIGEMFLNFPMHQDLQSYCGIDLSPLCVELGLGQGRSKSGRKLFERWVRCAMGLKSSPYVTTQGVGIAEEIVRGDRHDGLNVFHWDYVQMNIPGQKDYDPTAPWISKRRRSDGRIANDVVIYVDDARSTGASEDECWRAIRRVGSVLNSLGIQDAARKRRPPMTHPGAWAGAVFGTKGGVTVSVSQEKWDKAQAYLSELSDQVKSGVLLNMKRVMTIRGFLLYVSRAYPVMTPYLKGLHNTIDSWRGNRDTEGWKVSEGEMVLREDSLPDGEDWRSRTAPQFVAAAPRLSDDLEALRRLLAGPRPWFRHVRSQAVVTALYGFGDASASGFGATLETNGCIRASYGQWSNAVTEQSSNYRELTNLVLHLELWGTEGFLDGKELFLFTDNSTAEAVFMKGNSSVRGLFDGMLRLRELEVRYGTRLHIIHVSGDRMIRQGTDGLSRGDHSEGVMKGQPMLAHVPLHQSAFEVQPGLRQWVESWWPADVAGKLWFHDDPADWFDLAHQPGRHVWAPPPGAGDVVAEQLGRAIHKRPTEWHLILIPRLFVSRWGRVLGRESVFRLDIPAGTDGIWDAARFEPLLLYFVFPLIPVAPWCLRRTNYVETYRSLMREMWQGPEWRTRALLRQLIVRTWSLATLPEGVVREVLLHPRWKPLPHSAAPR